FDEALALVRDRIAFTTHTPLPAGNETYPAAQFLAAFGDLGRRLGLDETKFLDLCRVHPGTDEEPGLSPLAMRIAGKRNAVSALHGQVARKIWAPMFAPDEPPIDYVTNGVHMPTFLGEAFGNLLREHLGEPWNWEAVRDIPNAELWEARNAARRRLV